MIMFGGRVAVRVIKQLEKNSMLMKKLLTVLFLGLVSFVIAPQARASDEGKACKADTDCGHGEHCKEGHCHAH